MDINVGIRYLIAIQGNLNDPWCVSFQADAATAWDEQVGLYVTFIHAEW